MVDPTPAPDADPQNTPAPDADPQNTPDPEKDAGNDPGVDPGNTADPEGGDPSDKPKDGADADKGDEGGAPEQYADFTMPDGVNLDEKALAEFTPLAKELNLSQEQAQKLIDIEAKRVADAAAAQQEAWEGQVDTWVAEAKDDPEIGGQAFDANLAVASKALDAYGTPELRQILDDSGLGNHKEVIRFFHKIGKEIGEDNISINRQTSPARKSAAERMFPSMSS